MICTLKQRQTRTLIDRFGVVSAGFAGQSRDLALIAWGLCGEEPKERRRDLLIEIAQQVSDTTNLMIKLKQPR